MFSASCKCNEKAYHYCHLCNTYFCSSCTHSHKGKFIVSICEECEKEVSFLNCCNCEQVLCHECDTKIHNKGKRARHNRSSLYAGFVNAGRLVVADSIEELAKFVNSEELSGSEVSHYILLRDYPTKALETKEYNILNSLSESRNLAIILPSMSNVFTSSSTKCIQIKKATKPNKVEFQESTEKRKFSSESKSNGDDKLVTSTRADKSFSEKADRKNKSFSAYCSLSSNSFDATPIQLRKAKPSLNHSLANTTSANQPIFDFSQSFDIQKNKSFVFPSSQKFKETQIFGSLKLSISLQKDIFAVYEAGELLLPHERVKEIVFAFSKRENLSVNEVLEEAVKAGILREIEREFTENKKFVFYTLSLDYLSITSLRWILVSLRKDLLTPNERLILSRIKESFGLKISGRTWERILSALSTQPSCKSVFMISKLLDPFIGTETIALYLTPTQWPVEDVAMNPEEDERWNEFLTFLNSTFEETEAIPGGRYGCAQFIKLCGTSNLKDLSLGRLNLLVQGAINKNIIRYHRTLLVKNTSTPESSTNLVSQRKSEELRIVILEILQENRSGVCLAQLPLLLKRKLGSEISFPDLGFPKLKNFLSTMEDTVRIEMMGTNNSYAMLKDTPKSKSRSKNISSLEDYLIKVMTLIAGIVRENPFGIAIETLASRLNDRLGFEFNPKLFNVPDIYTFLTHFAENLLEIVCKKSTLLVYPKDMRISPPGFMPKKPPGLNPHSKPFASAEDEFAHKKSQSTTPQFSAPFSGFGWNKHTKNMPSLPDSSLSLLNYDNRDEFSYDSKQTVRMREESNLDIKENLKFIEELLQENDHDEKSLRTFFEKSDSDYISHTPQLSIGGFGMISGIKAGDDSSLHSKALSGDFGENFLSSNIKAFQHYRFMSNVESKNQFKF